MALLMEPGAEPHTESEQAALVGIAAIKEAAAREYKEQGNQFVRIGRKHYADAVDCYTNAIAQMEPVSSPDASVLFANRAHVNLLLGNHRRAPTTPNRRAGRPSLTLPTSRGLEQDPANEELKKLLSQVDARLSEQEHQRAKVAKAIATAKNLAGAMEKRGIKLGKTSYQELTGVKKPKLDDQGVLHWPVLLLYPEVMSSDFIEDFLETDSLSPHLDVMFSESSPPLPWDENHVYTREAIELYYQDGDTGKSRTVTSSSEDSSKWIKVKEGKTLQEVLQHKDHIIPAIPVLFVVSRNSAFYKKFTAGNWSLP